MIATEKAFPEKKWKRLERGGGIADRFFMKGRFWFVVVPVLLVFLMNSLQAADKPFVLFLVGDEEYRSEESLPMLAKILRRDYGYRVEVGFSVDEKGFVDPMNTESLTKMSLLKEADLVVMFLRFRRPPRYDFEYFLKYLEEGKPVVAFRTSTHAFRFADGEGLNDWGYQEDPDKIHSNAGGDRVCELLGQSWIVHHGHFDDGTKPLTQVSLVDEEHPVMRGVRPFKAYSWLYHVEGGGDTLAGNPNILLKGRALKSNKMDKLDRYPIENPVAWTKTYKGKDGREGRVFMTTLGHPYDFQEVAMRRLAIQGMLWALGKEAKIPEKGVKVPFVGNYAPNNSGYGEGRFKAGMKPEDLFPN